MKLLTQGIKRVIIESILISLYCVSYGQTDLKSLLDISETNYPGVLAIKEKAEAAKLQVSLEKNTLLPSLDAGFQANYATYNNITGMNYPGLLVPISGPPSNDNNYDPVPGTGAGLIFKWSPVTFGQRAASAESIQKYYEQQLASVEDEVLKIKFRVALKYLEIAASEELIKSYQKNIESNEFELKQVSTLVNNGIRPDVDILKFKGELSKTKTNLLGLEDLMITQKQELKELLGTNDLPDVLINDFFFQNLPSIPADTDTEYEAGYDSTRSANPSLKMAHNEVEANKARLKQINRSWTPKLEFWATSYARGSGISFDGTVNKSDGWNFSRYNYGVGLQVVFPLLDLTNYKFKSHQQEALLRYSEYKFKQIQINLNTGGNIALNNLFTSLKIANEVPNEYIANESAYKALQIRYNAGLINYTELIQSQYDLLNSEARLKNAFINSWESLLRLAVIRGNIDVFLNQIKN
jgi:outer membrane protein